MSSLIDAINSGNYQCGVTASWVPSGSAGAGTIALTSVVGGTAGDFTVDTSGLTDASPSGSESGTGTDAALAFAGTTGVDGQGSVGVSGDPVLSTADHGLNSTATDVLSGSVMVQDGAETSNIVMGPGNDTYGALANDITNALGYAGVTASAGVDLYSGSSDSYGVTIDGSTYVDSSLVDEGTPSAGTLGAFASTDTLGGDLVFTVNGAQHTLQVNAGQNDTTVSTLAAAITADSSLGLSASVVDNVDGTQSIALTSLAGGSSSAFSVDTTHLTLTAPDADLTALSGTDVSFTSGAAGSGTAVGFNVPALPTNSYFNWPQDWAGWPQDLAVVENNPGLSDTDALSGTITLTQANGTPWTIDVNNMGGDPATLAGLAEYINGQNGYTASAQNVQAYQGTNQVNYAELLVDGPALNSNTSNELSIDASHLWDVESGAATATATLGPFSSRNDQLSAGTLAFSVDGSSTGSLQVGQGETVQSVVDTINADSSLGVAAAYDSGTGAVNLTSLTAGASGQFTVTPSAGLKDTGIADTGVLAFTAQGDEAAPVYVATLGAPTDSAGVCTVYGGFNSTDALSGSIEIQVGSSTQTFTMGQSYSGTAIETLNDLATAIQNSALGSDLSVMGPQTGVVDGLADFAMTSTGADAGDTVTILSDTLADPEDQVQHGSLGSYSSLDDLLPAGNLVFYNNEGIPGLTGDISTAGMTVGDLIYAINNNWCYGCLAQYNTATGSLDLFANEAGVSWDYGVVAQPVAQSAGAAGSGTPITFTGVQASGSETVSIPSYSTYDGEYAPGEQVLPVVPDEGYTSNSDILTGGITITQGSDSFSIANVSALPAQDQTYTGLASYIAQNSDFTTSIDATNDLWYAGGGTGFVIGSGAQDPSANLVITSTLEDPDAKTTVSGNLGPFLSESDMLSAGTLTFIPTDGTSFGSYDADVYNNPNPVTLTLNAPTTVAALVNAINNDAKLQTAGISASWDSSAHSVVLSGASATTPGFLVSTNITDLTPGGGNSNAITFTGGDNAQAFLITITQTAGGSGSPNTPQQFTFTDPSDSADQINNPDELYDTCGYATGTLEITSAEDPAIDIGTNAGLLGNGLDMIDFANQLVDQNSNYTFVTDGISNGTDPAFFTIQTPDYAQTGPITFDSTLAEGEYGSYATGAINGIASDGVLSGVLAIQMSTQSVENAQNNTLVLNPTEGETLADEATQITNSDLGVTAVAHNNGNGTQSLLLTSKTEGTNGDFTVETTDLEDPAPAGASLDYTASSPYTIALSNDANDPVYDSSSGQTSGAAAFFTTGSYTSSGIATISYSAKAGQNLGTTDLLTQSDSQAALANISSAITDIAAQDGYIGAQINTLTAVGQALGTQLDNVKSAQDAVQATDYAVATSNLAKYEILTQTGISALAQANSVQREIAKLLQ